MDWITATIVAVALVLMVRDELLAMIRSLSRAIQGKDDR